MKGGRGAKGASEQGKRRKKREKKEEEEIVKAQMENSVHRQQVREERKRGGEREEGGEGGGGEFVCLSEAWTADRVPRHHIQHGYPICNAPLGELLISMAVVESEHGKNLR